MPTYEYRCNACGREFEYQQKMADPDLVKCESCGEDKLEKLISWSAFQLKGGGWYKDLYASPQQQKQAAKDSVDHGVPPKQGEKAAERDAKNAAIDATAPAKTETKPSGGGDSGGGSSSSGGTSSSGTSGSSSSGAASKE